MMERFIATIDSAGLALRLQAENNAFGNSYDGRVAESH